MPSPPVLEMLTRSGAGYTNVGNERCGKIYGRSSFEVRT
jgi:hypothetical protein